MPVGYLNSYPWQKLNDSLLTLVFVDFSPEKVDFRLKITHSNNEKIFGISSIIAELTGKQHKDVMEAIRKMEPAWEKVHGSKFRLMFREVNIGNGAVRHAPCYSVTKTECLYIATKFNDEARAKLVLRCDE